MAKRKSGTKKQTKPLVQVKQNNFASIEMKLDDESDFYIQIGSWDYDAEEIVPDSVRFIAPCGEHFVCTRKDANFIASTLLKYLDSSDQE